MAGSCLEDQYFLQKVTLGKGSFGVVLRGVDRRTNEVVAVKQINKAFMRKANITQADVEREVKIMQACDHPSILRLFGFFQDSDCLSLALEYCDGGDFGDKLKEKASTLQEHEASEWMRQICGAIHALHSRGVCHRDVKPDNFMVAGSNPGVLKLADFGLSTFLRDGQRLHSKSGTPAFMAPEIHRLPENHEGYRFEVDMWAAGVLMFCLVNAGRHPFMDAHGKLSMSSLMNGSLDFASQNAIADMLPWPLQLCRSSDAAALCRRMVDPNPATRITAQEAMTHRWLLEAHGPRQQKPQATPRQQLPSDCKENWGGQAANKQKDLHRQNSFLKAQLRDNEAQLEVSKQRARDLLEMVDENTKEPQKTLCAPRKEAQGTLPAGTKCRYWSASQQQWARACIMSFNKDEGTYELDVKVRVPLDKIAPRMDVQVHEAWPRGTFVTYQSASSGKEVQAVVFGFKVPAIGPGTYVLDVKDSAEVDRIRPRQMKTR